MTAECGARSRHSLPSKHAWGKSCYCRRSHPCAGGSWANSSPGTPSTTWCTPDWRVSPLSPLRPGPQTFLLSGLFCLGPHGATPWPCSGHVHDPLFTLRRSLLVAINLRHEQRTTGVNIYFTNRTTMSLLHALLLLASGHWAPGSWPFFIHLCFCSSSNSTKAGVIFVVLVFLVLSQMGLTAIDIDARKLRLLSLLVA